MAEPKQTASTALLAKVDALTTMLTQFTEKYESDRKDWRTQHLQVVEQLSELEGKMASIANASVRKTATRKTDTKDDSTPSATAAITPVNSTFPGNSMLWAKREYSKDPEEFKKKYFAETHEKEVTDLIKKDEKNAKKKDAALVTLQAQTWWNLFVKQNKEEKESASKKELRERIQADYQAAKKSADEK